MVFLWKGYHLHRRAVTQRPPVVPASDDEERGDSSDEEDEEDDMSRSQSRSRVVISVGVRR